LALVQEELLEATTKRYHTRSNMDFSRHATRQHSGTHATVGVLGASSMEIKSPQTMETKGKLEDKFTVLREQRRAQGLCMKCGDKWNKGHMCIIVILVFQKIEN
jgi:hypothetical protein